MGPGSVAGYRSSEPQTRERPGDPTLPGALPGLLIYSFNPQPKARFAPLILAYGCGLNEEPSNQH